MDIYLVQRCRFKDTPNDKITGWDSLFNNDYMGSSEFEFGALPKSLKQLLKNRGAYVCIDSGIKAKDGKSLMLFCLPSVVSDVKEFLISKSENEHTISTKEGVWLKEALSGDSGWVNCNAWWDVENHWVAFMGEENEERIELALDRLEAKWKTEGKL